MHLIPVLAYFPQVHGSARTLEVVNPFFCFLSEFGPLFAINDYSGAQAKQPVKRLTDVL